MDQTIEVTAVLREIIKSSIREVLAEERISLIQAIIPAVSPKELADIKRDMEYQPAITRKIFPIRPYGS